MLFILCIGYRVDFSKFVVFLFDRFLTLLFLRLVHHGTDGLLNHGQDLRRLHVENFGDSSLHDEEMRVVHVQLDRSEEIDDAVVLDVGPVDQVFVLAAHDDLTLDDDLVEVFVTHGTILLVTVVECDRDGGFGDACLTVLVHQFLKVSCSNLLIKCQIKIILLNTKYLPSDYARVFY